MEFEFHLKQYTFISSNRNHGSFFLPIMAITLSWKEYSILETIFHYSELPGHLQDFFRRNFRGKFLVYLPKR